MNLTKQDVDTFHKHYVPAKATICWLWNGHTDALGYGRFTLESGITVSAHRVAYEIATGVDVTGKVVRQRCGNPSCINPMHLSTGEEDSLEVRIKALACTVAVSQAFRGARGMAAVKSTSVLRRRKSAHTRPHQHYK